MTITIYHNPNCTKSRLTLAMLKEKDLKPTVVEYLQTPPSVEELDGVLKKLNVEPMGIMRVKEDLYKELGLESKKLDRMALIEVLVQNPMLMERPIVVNGDKAAIGRPPENVIAIL